MLMEYKHVAPYDCVDIPRRQQRAIVQLSGEPVVVALFIIWAGCGAESFEEAVGWRGACGDFDLFENIRRRRELADEGVSASWGHVLTSSIHLLDSLAKELLVEALCE